VSLRFPKALPSWMYRDPAEFVQYDAGRTFVSIERIPIADIQPEPIIDRYHRQARRFHGKQLMRGKQ
jgi:hypothetical protein